MTEMIEMIETLEIAGADELRRKRQMRTIRFVAVLVVVVLLVVAQRLGFFRQFGDPAQLKQTLVELGPWGYLAFIGAYALFQPFGIPGTVFVMAAPLIWPWPVAFVLSMIGTMAASSVGFSFARFVARDWVSSLIPARFRNYEERLARRGFSTVFTLRFVFWMPPLLHAFFGISKVSFWTHFWASFLGYLVPLFLVSFFGQKLFDFMRTAPIGVYFIVPATVLTAVVVTYFVKREKREKRVAPPATDDSSA